MISGFWHCRCASRFHPIIGILKAPHQAMQILSSNQNFWMSSMVEHSCPALSRSQQVAAADSQESLSAHWQSHTARATTELSGQTSSVAPPPEVPHQNPLRSAQRGAVAGRDPLKPREVKRKTYKHNPPIFCWGERGLPRSTEQVICIGMCLEVLRVLHCTKNNSTSNDKSSDIHHNNY